VLHLSVCIAASVVLTRHLVYRVNNVLVEMLFNSLLAYETGRSFVIYPFTVDRYSDATFSNDHGKKVPTRIPFSAILSGPIVGAPWPASVTLLKPPPRSVSESYFEEVCPNPTVVTDQSIHVPDDATAEEMMQMWVDYLNGIEDGCVKVDWAKEHVFARL
jgi:hypothetical protein